MTDTATQTAVRYDRDADGIVTLTLDDPTASANTMNDLYLASMEAAVQRLHDEHPRSSRSDGGRVARTTEERGRDRAVSRPVPMTSSPSREPGLDTDLVPRPYSTTE